MTAHIVMKILIVLTSHSQLGDTGKKTGFWVEEFAAPYYELADAGAEITLASPDGGQPPIDPASQLAAAQTKFTHRFDQDEPLKQKLAHTLKLSEVKAADCDAVFYPGGHGPMWDLVNDTNSIALISAFQHQGKPSDRMPVAGMNRAERPTNAMPCQTGQNMDIGRKIIRIVVIDEVAMRDRP